MDLRSKCKKNYKILEENTRENIHVQGNQKEFLNITLKLQSKKEEI